MTEPDISGNILVTGACGLVGRALSEELAARGRRVCGTDRPRSAPGPVGVPLVVGDLGDSACAARACDGVAAVIHCAAVQYHSGVPRIGRRRFFAQNVEATRSLLDAARRANVSRLVYVSSDMVYGIPMQSPMPESHPTRPIGPYGQSKLAAERLCEEFARDTGARVVILRPRLIVGPGRLGVLRVLFDRIRAGRPIPMFGSGRNRYQMVAVDDVVSACVLALERPVSGVFNLGSDAPPPVRDLLTELAQRVGSRARPLVLPAGVAQFALQALHAVRVAPLQPEQFRIAALDYVLDTRRARDVLGWRPQHGDLEMLLAAYRAYVGGDAAIETPPAAVHAELPVSEVAPSSAVRERGLQREEAPGAAAPAREVRR